MDFDVANQQKVNCTGKVKIAEVRKGVDGDDGDKCFTAAIVIATNMIDYDAGDNCNYIYKMLVSRMGSLWAISPMGTRLGNCQILRDHLKVSTHSEFNCLPVYLK